MAYTIRLATFAGDYKKFEYFIDIFYVAIQINSHIQDTKNSTI